MIELKKNYKLWDNEYIISADNPDLKNYQVFHNGVLLKDVTAIVRVKRD